MNNYIIRKIAYQYNDEYFNLASDGAIEAEFDTYEAAYQAWREKEIEKLRAWNLAELEPLSPCAGDTEEAVAKLNSYVQEHLHISLLEQDDDFLEEFYIPASATDEQVWEIGELVGIKFYTLSVFKEAPSFFVIEKRAPFFDETEIINKNGAPLFYSTYEEAVSRIGYEIEDFVIKGTPEEVSDMPAIFRQIVASHSMFRYDEKQQQTKVDIDWELDAEKNKKLNELIATMKVKPFEIRPFSIEEARKIRHHLYEMN